MSIIVSNIRIGLDTPIQEAINIAINKLCIPKENIITASLFKKSLDARHKGNISFVCSVSIEAIDEHLIKVGDNVRYFSNEVLKINKQLSSDESITIIGFGPASIFAALILAQNGFRPIVYERGGDVDSRVGSVNEFWNCGKLNSNTNVQFGEGGAGTFSDGKLTTGISDKLCRYVLETFVNNGASSEILTKSKPHIGTDKLIGIIKSIRKQIIELGGEVHFNSTLTDIKIHNNKINSIFINGNEINAQRVILAIGHSARDTFSMLYKNGVDLENKAFSVGVRIEQPQELINKGLYGDFLGHKNLPQGEYAFSHRTKDRCVYTFCMCPGGIVVPSSSSENTVVTNGMSEYNRDKLNANSALVVSVSEADYGTLPLSGLKYQQHLEQTAFILGGSSYKAPASTVGGFLAGSMKSGIEPSYSLGVTLTDISQLFSNDINRMLRLGLQMFDKKLNGFSDYSGILTGVESRTSSPIRILRNEKYISTNVDGLYPCGEGAGYAGGIMSAAVDGIKVAVSIMGEK